MKRPNPLLPAGIDEDKLGEYLRGRPDDSADDDDRDDDDDNDDAAAISDDLVSEVAADLELLEQIKDAAENSDDLKKALFDHGIMLPAPTAALSLNAHFSDLPPVTPERGEAVAAEFRRNTNLDFDPRRQEKILAAVKKIQTGQDGQQTTVTTEELASQVSRLTGLFQPGDSWADFVREVTEAAQRLGLFTDTNSPGQTPAYVAQPQPGEDAAMSLDAPTGRTAEVLREFLHNTGMTRQAPPLPRRFR